MARQLTFDLPPRPAMGREDFFPSAANATALALIDGWRDWAMGKLILVGPEGAGKTHLAHVWAAQSGARIVDAHSLIDHPTGPLVVEDADMIAGDAAAEETLFHLHNALANDGHPLLMTARRPPSRWGLVLPDLASRMAQAGLAEVAPPDDALLMAVMMKRAVDRNLDLTPRMLNYIAPRLPRDFAAADAVIRRIDALALAEKRKPNFNDARAALADIAVPPSS